MENELEKLKLEETELRNKLSDNHAKQAVIIANNFSEKLGFKSGDIVTIKNKKGVLRIYTQNLRPELEIQYFKNDGSLGQRTSRVYSWDYEFIKLIG